MATTNTWDQVVSKITGVVNRGAFSKTYTPSTSRQTRNGSAGYYSSITTVCNAVSLSGNASTSQVLTGRTFYTTSLTKRTGTMANRGRLNWSGSNTTYSVPAGHYSGGTLDSRTSYNNGYNSGVNAGRNSPAFFVSHGSQNPPNDNSATYYLPSTSYAAANVGISQNSHATIQISGTYRLFVNATWTGADPKNMFANV